MREEPERPHNCNLDGCPGMAHLCDRISLWAAEDRFRHGKYTLEVAEAFRLEYQKRGEEILKLKEELLETYRRIHR